MKSVFKSLGLVAGGVVLGVLALQNRQLRAENDSLFEMLTDDDCCPCDPCADCDGCDGCPEMRGGCEPEAEPVSEPESAAAED